MLTPLYLDTYNLQNPEKTLEILYEILSKMRLLLVERF